MIESSRRNAPGHSLATFRAFAALVALAMLAGCAKKSSPTAPAVTRSYFMGFSATRRVWTSRSSCRRSTCGCRAPTPG